MRYVYREVLGWEVKLDVVVADETPSKLLAVPKAKERIVAMGHPQAMHGWIGLLQYLEPADLDVRPLDDKKPNQPYPVAFVFRATDIQETYNKVRALGATVVCPPIPVNYPNRAPGWGMSCLDPNGVLFDVTAYEDKLL